MGKNTKKNKAKAEKECAEKAPSLESAEQAAGPASQDMQEGANEPEAVPSQASAAENSVTSANEESNGHVAGEEPVHGSQEAESKVPKETGAEAAKDTEAKASDKADVENTERGMSSRDAQAPGIEGESGPSLESQVKDLQSQVMSMNLKLVRAYESRGDLEVDVQERDAMIAKMRSRIADLEARTDRWEHELNTGTYIEKDNVQNEMQRLMSTALEEAKSRESAIAARATLEREIDELTSSLFKEANRMVAVERVIRSQAEERMNFLETMNLNMVSVVQGLKESLQEKVSLLESLNGDADVSRDTEAVSGGAKAKGPAPIFISPSHVVYAEFVSFIEHLKNMRATLQVQIGSPTRVASDSRRTIDHLLGESAGGTAGSSTSIEQANDASPMSILQAPSTSVNAALLISSHTSHPFVKRCIEEDHEPNLWYLSKLNLFIRPRISSAIMDGNLVIEPMSSHHPLPSTVCALCKTSLLPWWTGPVAEDKNRSVSKWFKRSDSAQSSPRPQDDTAQFSKLPTDETPVEGQKEDSVAPSPVPVPVPAPAPATEANDHLVQSIDPSRRIHAFRTSENSTQKYPICPECLPRLRALCEFWKFIRMICRSVILDDNVVLAATKSAAEKNDAENDAPDLQTRLSAADSIIQKAHEANVGRQVKLLENDPDDPIISFSSLDQENQDQENLDQENLDASDFKDAEENVSADGKADDADKNGHAAPVKDTEQESSATQKSAPGAELTVDTQKPAQQVHIDGLWLQQVFTEVVQLKEAMFWARMGNANVKSRSVSVE